MSPALNNITTADVYTPANTLLAPGSERLTIHARPVPGVDGSGAIYYQLGQGWPAAIWRDEVQMPPGSLSGDRRFDAVRVRSAAPGTPAQVTIDAGASEVNGA